MFSFKPLALYALLAFGVLSSVAIPRNRAHTDSNGSDLSDTIQTLSTSLQGPLAQMGKTPAAFKIYLWRRLTVNDRIFDRQQRRPSDSQAYC